MVKPAVLYVSYDGMLEPLGQSQVIAYLERLTDEARIQILSFEKPADWGDRARRNAIARRLDAAGIGWHPLIYHQHPTLLATLFDIAQGITAGLWLALRHRVRIVHARSYIAALIGLVVKRLTGAKLLFDMRGLWADERVDGGIWPVGGRVYSAVKQVEKHLLRGADHIVTLTHASVGVIEALPGLSGRKHAPIAVITTCADLDRFSPGTGTGPEHFTLGYLGTVGATRLFGEVLACFSVLRELRPDARLLVVNRNEQADVRRMIGEAGIPAQAVEIAAAEHAEVPALIRRMNAGATINRISFSEVARAPTRVAEFLGCGVPCLANNGIGDLETILDDETAGVLLRDFSQAERRRAVERLLELDADPATAAHCRAIAVEHFSLESGVEAYRTIYRELGA